MKIMNKKTIFISLSVLVIAVMAVVNINYVSKNSGLSNLSLANVEALAQVELPPVTITCGQFSGKCWKFAPYYSGEYYHPCQFSGYQSDYCS